MISSEISEEEDKASRLDLMLNELKSGRLSRRIAEVARLAVVRHEYGEAQEMQAVEAEHSARLA